MTEETAHRIYSFDITLLCSTLASATTLEALFTMLARSLCFGIDYDRYLNSGDFFTRSTRPLCLISASKSGLMRRISSAHALAPDTDGRDRHSVPIWSLP